MNTVFAEAIYILRWFAAAAVIGLLTGFSTNLFLTSLDMVSAYRLANPTVMIGLPLYGALIAWVYERYGKEANEETELIIREVQNPSEKTIPLRMYPLVLIGTLLTHFGGGSAGREGTAVQMSAALADAARRFFKMTAETRRVLLMTGVAAGFGAVFGTPLAGFVFALEFIAIGEIRYFALLPVLLAPIISHTFAVIGGVQHAIYPVAIDQFPKLDFKTIALLLIAGLIFGLVAQLFSLSLNATSAILKEKIKNNVIRAAAGGVVVVALVFALKASDFTGLGIAFMQQAFAAPVTLFPFIAKLVLTVITVSVGFKGGVVTPLLFIGCTLGSALSHIIPLPVSVLAAAGFVAVFAGASNAPLTCIVMSFELFGVKAAPYCAIAVVASYLSSGLTGIYTAQLVQRNKFGIDFSAQGVTVDIFVKQTINGIKERFIKK